MLERTTVKTGDDVWLLGLPLLPWSAYW